MQSMQFNFKMDVNKTMKPTEKRPQSSAPGSKKRSAHPNTPDDDEPTATNMDDMTFDWRHRDTVPADVMIRTENSRKRQKTRTGNSTAHNAHRCAFLTFCCIATKESFFKACAGGFQVLDKYHWLLPGLTGSCFIKVSCFKMLSTRLNLLCFRKHPAASGTGTTSGSATVSNINL